MRTSGRLIFNTSGLMLDAAAAGHGLAWVPGDLAAKHLGDGSLMAVLEIFSITYPGHHVYYATRRDATRRDATRRASLALPLVVEALRLQPT